MADANIKLPPSATRTLGKSGTPIFAGRISYVDYARDLQGWAALDAWDVMRKSDPVIKAILRACKEPILGADWGIEPASDDPRDIKIAEHAYYEFFDRALDYYDTMREGLSFLEFGHFVAEKVYDTTAIYKGTPYIGFSSIESRKQRTILKWQMDNGKPGVTQLTPYGGYVDIPRTKLLYAVNNQEGENYLGESMLRPAYKPWKIKDGLEIMNAIALENQGMGIPYIKKGINNQTVDETELQNVRERVRQQRANEESYWEYPASIEVGFVDMKGHTTKDIGPELKRLNEEITLSALVQFLLLGQTGGSGSRAVSQDHSRLFVKSLVSTARTWQQAFQRDVINDWVDLNYSNLQNGYPKLTFSTISDEDVPETSQAVNLLMAVGAITAGLDVENRLRKMLNLKELSRQEYDKLQQDKQQQQKAAEPNNPEKDKQEGKADPKQQPKDERVKASIAEAEQIEKQLLNILAEQ